MLLEFSVSNYRSILGRQTLSLIASSSHDLENSHVYAPGGKQPRVVRSAVIYGPNAAGKSNLMQAAGFAQAFIISSAQLQEGQPINVTPFALSRKSIAEPSEFEFLFVEDGLRYHYGFALTPERVVKEWLVAYPKGKQRWFEREYNAKEGKYVWTLGDNLRGERSQRHTWRDSTRSNALFLSTAVQLNSDQLRPVFSWFQNKLGVITFANNVNRLLSTELLRDPERKHLLDQFIRAADVGIEQLEYREERAQPGTVININLGTPGFPASTSFPLLGQVLASHKFIDGEGTTQLNFDFAESDGTKKLFEYAGAWIKALNDGATLLVDELDRSLHPLMTRFLVQLFHDPNRSARGAQLVYTTHDTTLLDAKLLRRDQVWFVEKDEHSSTHLYPLLEYSPRTDEALERGYLKGRYGAIRSLPHELRCLKGIFHRSAVNDHFDAPQAVVLLSRSFSSSARATRNETISRPFAPVWDSRTVEIAEKTGMDPRAVVRYVEQRVRDEGPFEHIICAFDRDSHTHFASARARIRELGEGRKALNIREAVTIPCIELWILLHFERTSKPFQSSAEVITHIEDAGYIPSYNKTDTTMCRQLMSRMDDAIANAVWLTVRGKTDGFENPSTNLHDIIALLRSLAV